MKKKKTTLPVGVYSIEEILESNCISDRVRWMVELIKRDGTKCKCGKEGTYFECKQGKYKGDGVHLDFYAEDGTLMTIDHIKPKSLGGKNHISNFQMLCEPCNVAKGCKE